MNISLLGRPGNRDVPLTDHDVSPVMSCWRCSLLLTSMSWMLGIFYIYMLSLSVWLYCNKSIYIPGFDIIQSKAVGRGDKTTRPVRVRVLALLENPWRVWEQVLALLENPQRVRVLDPSRLKNPRQERVLDRWFEARDSLVDIIVLVPWIEYGTRTRMSTDGWLEPWTMDLNGTKKLRNIGRLNLFLIQFHFIFLVFI